jgi:cobalamin biosynthesis protein CobT
VSFLSTDDMSSALSKKVQEEEDDNDSDLFDDDVLNGSDVDEKETPSTLSDVPTPTLSHTESESHDETSKESQATSSSARHEILYQIEFFNEHSKSPVISLQFISPRCTLYEVVECLFENYLEEHLSQAIYSHLWCLFVDKKNEFIGPFPDSVFCESQVNIHVCM